MIQTMNTKSFRTTARISSIIFFFIALFMTDLAFMTVLGAAKHYFLPTPGILATCPIVLAAGNLIFLIMLLIIMNTKSLLRRIFIYIQMAALGIAACAYLIFVVVIMLAPLITKG